MNEFQHQNPNSQNFYWNKTQNKFQASCKSCHYQRTRNWQHNNYEYWMGLNHQWMIDHPDKMKASRRKCRDNNPEVYKALAEKSLANLHQREIDDPEWAIANSKKSKAKRRALERNAEGSHTTADIRQLYEDQCGLCAYCGIRLFEDYHLDHIHPLSRGGSNWPDNLCLTCPDCNLSKSDKLLSEWIAVRGW